MTGPDAGTLPVGHTVRSAAATALWVSVAGATAFTAFAWVTTQAKSMRAGSPWQNDPYDGVVSFTEFLVPALAVLMVARFLLVRRDEPQPVFRIAQLVRAAFVSTLLVAATVTTDWLAVAVRADRRLWNDGTPWSIAALVPLTVAVVAALLSQGRAFRRLPPGDPRSPDGDWLDDLGALIDASAGRLPSAGRRLAARVRHAGAIEFVRRHIVAFAAAASLAASLAVTTAQALGEHWTSPVLFITGTFIGAGGFFAFSMVCNSALRIAAPRTARGGRAETLARVRRPARVAAITGSAAMPTSAVLRDGIWAALGFDGQIDAAVELAVITFGAALSVVVLVYGFSLGLAAMTGRRSSRRARG